MAWSDAARAAAAEMRRRRKIGEPWRRSKFRITVEMKDPTRVGGTGAHHTIVKSIKVRDVRKGVAIERAMKFYRRRGYTQTRVRSTSVEILSAKAPGRQWPSTNKH